MKHMNHRQAIRVNIETTGTSEFFCASPDTLILLMLVITNVGNYLVLFMLKNEQKLFFSPINFSKNIKRRSRTAIFLVSWPQKTMIEHTMNHFYNKTFSTRKFSTETWWQEFKPTT